MGYIMKKKTKIIGLGAIVIAVNSANGGTNLKNFIDWVDQEGQKLIANEKMVKYTL